MEPNNSTPSQTPSNAPLPTEESPEQPTQAGLPPATGMPQKSKWPFIIVLIVVLAAIGTAIYFFMIKDDSDQSTAEQSNSQTNTTEEVALTTSSLSNNDENYGQGTISVTHPESWEVTTDKDQDGANQLVIKSAAGNVLRITEQIGGLGGTCEPDTYSYTLVKKLPTQSASYVFTEYTTTDPILQQRYLGIESLANASSTHKSLTDGASNTDVCTNIGLLYPIVNGMFVRIENADGDEVPYDTLKSDTDFITMLESFKESAL